MVFADVRPGPPRPLWATERADDELSRLSRELNLDHLAMARACCPREDADVEQHLSLLTAMLSLPRHRASAYCDIGLMLARFPALASRLAHGMLGFDHLTMMARALEGVTGDPDHAIELGVIGLLQPRRDGQTLPGVRALHNRIQSVVAGIDALARPLDPGETASTVASADRAEPRRRLDVLSFPDSPVTTITAVLTDAEAEEFTAVLDAVCRKLDCSRADGLMHLARGNADVSVTLNLFRDPGSPVAATANGTWLSALATERFMARVSTLRILSHGATEHYTPTEAMVAFVRGRDGTCRFPGCEVPATDCDLDHVTRYLTGDPAVGGPTSTTNLHCLCRKHHTMKTMGWFDVTLAVDGSEMWTSVGDGHIFLTEPTGPLATYVRATFRSRATRRTATLREHNRLRLEADEVLRGVVREAVTETHTGEVPF